MRKIGGAAYAHAASDDARFAIRSASMAEYDAAQKVEDALTPLRRKGLVPEHLDVTAHPYVNGAAGIESKLHLTSANSIYRSMDLIFGTRHGFKVSIDEGLVERMSILQLQAVILHEIGHIKNAGKEILETFISDIAVFAGYAGGAIYEYTHRTQIMHTLQWASKHVPGGKYIMKNAMEAGNQFIHIQDAAYKFAVSSLHNSVPNWAMRDAFIYLVASEIAAPLSYAAARVRNLNWLRISRKIENKSDLFAAKRVGTENMASALLLLEGSEKKEKKRGIFRRLTDSLINIYGAHPVTPQRVEYLERRAG